jgi:methylenetetrahydrofolate dehydrogenase (NADP+)/methenyltetrahydrofolate cyclohydrolase
MRVEIFGQDESFLSEDEGLQFYQKQEYDSVPKVIELIHYLNYDQDCVGIIVQLPLPEQFQSSKAKILSSIQAHKDVDGLGGVINGLSQVELLDFLPATPRAVIELLRYYNHDIFKGKTVAILGQSNLIGKPLAAELMKRGATVYSTNVFNDAEKTKKACQLADFIISATGKVGLVDETFLRKEKDQVIVDVGYGYKNGSPVGDVAIEKIKDKIFAYTPVPG